MSRDRSRWYRASYSPKAEKLMAEHGREIARQIVAGADTVCLDGKVVLRRRESLTVFVGDSLHK